MRTSAAAASPPSSAHAAAAPTAAAEFVHARIERKRVMWSNILAYMQRRTTRDTLVELEFPYRVELQPLTKADRANIAHLEFAPSAILPGLMGIFLRTKYKADA